VQLAGRSPRPPLAPGARQPAPPTPARALVAARARSLRRRAASGDTRSGGRAARRLPRLAGAQDAHGGEPAAPGARPRALQVTLAEHKGHGVRLVLEAPRSSSRLLRGPACRRGQLGGRCAARRARRGGRRTGPRFQLGRGGQILADRLKGEDTVVDRAPGARLRSGRVRCCSCCGATRRRLSPGLGGFLPSATAVRGGMSATCLRAWCACAGRRASAVTARSLSARRRHSRPRGEGDLRSSASRRWRFSS
jgi:hypothetical protein